MSRFDTAHRGRFERVAERVLPRPLFDWLRGLAEEPGTSAQFRGRHIGDWWVNSIYDLPLANKDTPWAYSTDDDNAILGDPPDWERYKLAHLLVNTTQEAVPQRKRDYVFPVCKVIDGELRYVFASVQTVMGMLNGSRGWRAPSEEVRRALYSTVSRLYERFDEEPTALRELSLGDAALLVVGEGLEAEVEERDGLIWKQDLRPGVFEDGRGGRIAVSRRMMEQMVEAFGAKVLEYVAIPQFHTDNPVFNTGFVEALELRDDGLWAGMRFTETEVEEKARRGTIAQVSVALERDVEMFGRVWPWVLWHVALTNTPIVRGMEPFAAIAASLGIATIFRPQEVTSVNTVDANGNQTPNPSEAEELRRRLAELEEENRRLVLSQAEAQRRAHETEVRSILAALQGSGRHEAVKLPEGGMFPAHVVKVVEPILMADQGRESRVQMSLDSEDKGSATEVVLAVLNAVAQASPDGLLSRASFGRQEHSKPQDPDAPVSTDEKDRHVDEYLKERGLVAVGGEQ